MTFLEKIRKNKGEKCACSSPAKYKLKIESAETFFCTSCAEYILNRLEILTKIKASKKQDDKTYSREVYNRNFAHWSDSEDEILKTSGLTPRHISKELSRTEASVRRRIYKLGLKPNK
ncbi:MAG: hypothetical protein ACRCX2_03720 [Paraclostridium sp.]